MVENQQVRYLRPIAPSDTLVVGWAWERALNQASGERDRSRPIVVTRIGESLSGDGLRAGRDEDDECRKHKHEPKGTLSIKQPPGVRSLDMAYRGHSFAPMELTSWLGDVVLGIVCGIYVRHREGTHGGHCDDGRPPRRGEGVRVRPHRPLIARVHRPCLRFVEPVAPGGEEC